ncbi:MAG: hypothetical protein IKW13_02470 [Thermoguttaceae bacterium]|nr:hypothetical protein [Thermoguttaceae bacterium]
MRRADALVRRKCPHCNAAQTVEIPAAPIALPNFAPSPTRRDVKNAVATEPLTLRSNEPSATQAEKTPQTAPQVEQEKTTPQAEPQVEQEKTTPQAESKVEQEKTTPQAETKAEQEKTTRPTEPKVEQEKTTRPTEPQAEQEETAPPERSQRLETFRRAVAAWRATFAAETASVTIPRGRAARYALAILVELVACPPCAIFAAYFFTRALFADRRALYHAAMLEMEKTRRTLAVGIGVFAAFLCAFIFYVQSQEVDLPTEPSPASRLFKK